MDDQLQLIVDEPFWCIPVDRYGRQLDPIPVNDGLAPQGKEWQTAVLFARLAIHHAERYPPGWLAWQTWPC